MFAQPLERPWGYSIPTLANYSPIVAVVRALSEQVMSNRIAAVGIALAILLATAPRESKAQSSLPRKGVDGKEDVLRGVMEAFRNTEVASAEVGILREVLVVPGEHVKEGQLLARLDDELQRIQLEEAQLEWESRGALESAQHEFEFNRQKLTAIEDLSKRTRVSPLELNRDTLELKIAEAKWKTQQEAKEIARARMMRAEQALAARSVKAPHEGIVVEILREPGEYLAANQPVVARIQDTSKLRARFYLSDEMAHRFRGRPTANVRLPNGTIIPSEIEFIAPLATENSTEMTVLVSNPTGEVRSSSCDLIRP
jgi:RND family efflux transporter MFP subunit